MQTFQGHVTKGQVQKELQMSSLCSQATEQFWFQGGTILVNFNPFHIFFFVQRMERFQPVCQMSLEPLGGSWFWVLPKIWALVFSVALPLASLLHAAGRRTSGVFVLVALLELGAPPDPDHLIFMLFGSFSRTPLLPLTFYYFSLSLSLQNAGNSVNNSHLVC